MFFQNIFLYKIDRFKILRRLNNYYVLLFLLNYLLFCDIFTGKMSFDKCEIFFKVKAHTNLNQSVRIIGNIEHLGFWSPTAALQLTTNTNDYPYWSSTIPILLPKGTKMASFTLFSIFQQAPDLNSKL